MLEINLINFKLYYNITPLGKKEKDICIVNKIV